MKGLLINIPMDQVRKSGGFVQLIHVDVIIGKLLLVKEPVLKTQVALFVPKEDFVFMVLTRK